MMTPTSQTAAKYEFLGIVDKPKAGVTYKVRNLVTGEFEILRALPGNSYADAESRERFLREIKIHTRLSHPNIVAFHDALELDGQLVMTAEFVEGATMAETCSAGPMPSREALLAICDVLSGLEEAHALDIVHRGITAEHVILSRDGTAKLGGFGLAKSALDVSLTRAGSVMGDARYISPEQVTAIAAPDARADLYSVGILLFQALTGKVPFEGKNDFEVMSAQVSAAPPKPSSLNPAISPALERIVLTALAKKPEERFPGAREFRSALLGLEESLPAAEPAAPPALSTAASSGRRRLPYLLGTCGVAIAGLILYYLSTH